MKTTKAVILFFVVLIMASCSGKRALKAKMAFEIGEYDRAENLYAKAIVGEKNRYNKADYAFHMGECYRRKGLYKKALSSYQTALKNKHKDNELYYLIAECMLIVGQYDKAEENYEMYKSIVPHNAAKADVGIASCRQAKANAATLKQYDYKTTPDTGYVITIAKALNSKSSDYSPAYVGDDYDVIYFTSMRSPKKRRKANRVTGQSNSTIYMSKLDSQDDWTEPEPLDEPFSQKFDDGTPCLSADGKTMFFTRCPYDAERENNAECYEVRRSGGRWGEPVRVLPGGDSTMMVAHPAISPDGETLYFVSDKDGGRGGKDLYYTTKTTDGGWSEAVNMGGIINTKGDEMFPYVRSNGDLYFCSNGHIGYGGLDIFKATRNESGRYTVTNMGLPINSSADDFGIVFKGNKEEGLFSSGRLKAGIDNLFTFSLPEVVLMCEGRMTDHNGNVPEKAFVKVIGSDGTNVRLKPSDDGSFGLMVEPGNSYLIQCGARGYISQTIKIDTHGKSRSENINVGVKLKPVN